MEKKKNRRMRNANGLGTCYKLSGKRRKPYMVRIPDGVSLEMIDGKPNGKYKYKTLGYFETYEEGMFALYKYNDDPYDIDARSITFGELWQKVYDREIAKLSASRKSSYKTAVKRLTPILNTAISDLKSYHLQSTIDQIEDDKYKLTADMKAVMNKVYSYAIEYEIIDKDYSEHVKAFSQTTKTEKGIFSKEEIKTLFDNDYDLTAKYVLILIHTGMRISELLEVKKENVHIKERYIIAGSKTEAGRNRIIPLCDKIIRYFEELYELNTTYLIEHNGKKLSYNNFNMRFYGPLMNRLNIKHFIHETRHTFISLMDSTRCNPAALKRIVGHQCDDVTYRYTHKTIEELLLEVNRI